MIKVIEIKVLNSVKYISIFVWVLIFLWEVGNFSILLMAKIAKIFSIVTWIKNKFILIALIKIFKNKVLDLRRRPMNVILAILEFILI